MRHISSILIITYLFCFGQNLIAQNIKSDIDFQKQSLETEFNWIDFWGLVEDSTTYEIIYNGTEILGDTIVRLENPSIIVRKEEAGGGIITFKKGEYKWIHQSD